MNISTRKHRTNRFNYDLHARLELHQDLPHLGLYHKINRPNIHSGPVRTNGPPKPNFFTFYQILYAWGMYDSRKRIARVLKLSSVSPSSAPT